MIDESVEPGESEGSRRDPAEIAREAMNRARASARERGAARTSPQRARADRNRKREDGAAEPYAGGREPRPMSEGVESLLRRMGWTEQVEVAAVTARWREVIGDQIADHCEPVSFEEGALTLRASSTAWATQLTLMAGQIRHRLNEEFGREIVTELRILGPVARSWTRGPRTVKGRGPRDTYG
jgi:predicted nucleic acid-binding Zn ribbon protein